MGIHCSMGILAQARRAHCQRLSCCQRLSDGRGCGFASCAPGDAIGPPTPHERPSCFACHSACAASAAARIAAAFASSTSSAAFASAFDPEAAGGTAGAAGGEAAEGRALGLERSPLRASCVDTTWPTMSPSGLPPLALPPPPLELNLGSALWSALCSRLCKRAGRATRDWRARLALPSDWPRFRGRLG